MTATGDLRPPDSCPRCGAALSSGSPGCPHCRAEGGGPSRSPETDRIDSLLSAANVARMRGRWDDAIQKCVEALRLDPHNATAHSLVGDIYQDQGRREEAIQWYQMALDLNPGGAADRMKLDRLKTPPDITESFRPPFWVRVGAPSIFILAFVMMVVGLWALVGAKRVAPNLPQNPEEPPPMTLPPGLRPDSAPVAPPRPAAPRPSWDNLMASVETIPEASLHRALNDRLKGSPSLRVFYVQADPGTDDVTVSLFYGPEGRLLKDEDLAEAAYKAASLVFHESGSIENLSIRLLYRAREKAAPEWALIARTNRSRFMTDRSPSTVGGKARAFDLFLWNPFLFPAAPDLGLPPSASANPRPATPGEAASGPAPAPGENAPP